MGQTYQLPIHVKDAPAIAQDRKAAVCAVIPRESIEKRADGKWWPRVNGRQPDMSLERCRGTGLLLNPTCVVTAEDVVAPGDELAIVFDFYLGDRDVPTSFDHDQVRVDVRVTPNGLLDLLEFDEPLNDRPLLSDLTHFVQENEVMFALGHAAGVPLQYWGQAPVVCSGDDCQEFVTTLRFPLHASGSPVFLASGEKAGRAVGVHHRGQNLNTEYRLAAGCMCAAKDQSWETRLSILTHGSRGSLDVDPNPYGGLS
jgi:hypothetical protein